VVLYGLHPPLPPSFHPHSLLSEFSLGASWAFSFQQVLLPENRPWLSSLRLKVVRWDEKAGLQRDALGRPVFLTPERSVALNQSRIEERVTDTRVVGSRAGILSRRGSRATVPHRVVKCREDELPSCGRKLMGHYE
jgi:hypothetical protein